MLACMERSTGSIDDGRVSFGHRPANAGTDDDEQITSVDPVCAVSIATTDALAASEFQGRRFFFCSHECKEEFDRRPATYVRRLQDWDGPTLNDK
jgi:YHS domain-containing protein